MKVSSCIFKLIRRKQTQGCKNKHQSKTQRNWFRKTLRIHEGCSVPVNNNCNRLLYFCNCKLICHYNYLKHTVCGKIKRKSHILKLFIWTCSSVIFVKKKQTKKKKQPNCKVAVSSFLYPSHYHQRKILNRMRWVEIKWSCDLMTCFRSEGDRT